jgi:periplasmic mercuric ion binding protein
MKNIIFLFIVCFGNTQLKAQTKTDTLTVNGTCTECKGRIEEAVFKIKGVKSAKWDKKTKIFKVVYNSKKTNLLTIETRIAGVGHDTPNVKATDEVYKSLPGCCAYRSGQTCVH